MHDALVERIWSLDISEKDVDISVDIYIFNIGFEKGIEVSFTHAFEPEDNETFFAFTFPWSYEEDQVCALMRWCYLFREEIRGDFEVIIPLFFPVFLERNVWIMYFIYIW